jgi:hypothetical protein
MKDMANSFVKDSVMGMNHGKRMPGNMDATTSIKAGMGRTPMTGRGMEIPVDVMPGTQRAYPPLTGDFGGTAAFGFGMKRPR